MAKLFNGMINFASAIKPTGAQPLDDRTVVQSFADLLADDTFGLAKYNGMLVAVVEDEQVYMLKNAANSTSEDAWVAVGSGNGSLAVEEYKDAVVLATDDNIGQVIYVKTKSEYDADGEGEGAAVEYDAAPYIVIGQGQLQKLAASTASGNLDADVAELKTKVSGIESEIGKAAAGEDAATGLYKEIADAEDAAKTYAEGQAAQALADAKTYTDGKDEAMDGRVKVLEAIDHDAYIGADATLKSEIEGELGKKVDKVEGSRLMTNDEGTKLGNIEAGAQVNKLEVVKVNGQALVIAEADKSVDVIVPTAPVQGVADGEKVISLDGDKLKTTLTLAYVPASDEQNAVLRLQGINGEVVSSIDATAFVKDGMLDSAKLDGPKEGEPGEKYLVLTFNTAAGKEDIRMDVTDLLDYYAAGDGLVLDGKTFKVKIDETANTYLQVTTNGIAVSQAFLDKITELDNEVLRAAKEYADGLAGNYEVAGAAAQALADAKAYTDEREVEIDKKWAAADTQVLADAKKYADDTFVTKDGFNEFEASYEEKLNNIAEGAQVNVIEAVKVNGIDAVVSEGKVAELEITAKDIALGGDITGTTGDAIYSGDTKISTVLQGIQDSIRAAVAGGVNSVTSADTAIEVNNADPNNPKISVKIETATDETVAAGHIELVKGNEGLYGFMYYDGDDAEVLN